MVHERNDFQKMRVFLTGGFITYIHLGGGDAHA